MGADVILAGCKGKIMRLARHLCLLSAVALGLAGVSLAQETDFSTGPQYLITSGSPQFFHSIATPSLSLNTTPENPYAANADGTSSTALAVAPPIAANPDLQPIYWGEPKTIQSGSEIEITSAEIPLNLPPSIFDAGTVAFAGSESLGNQEPTTLGATAAALRAHSLHASHVYTNADVDRPNGN